MRKRRPQKFGKKHIRFFVMLALFFIGGIFEITVSAKTILKEKVVEEEVVPEPSIEEIVSSEPENQYEDLAILDELFGTSEEETEDLLLLEESRSLEESSIEESMMIASMEEESRLQAEEESRRQEEAALQAAQTETPAPAPETAVAEVTPPPTSPPQQVAYNGTGNIHALSADEVYQIQATYDCSARGYGGLQYNTIAPGIQAQLNGLGNGKAMLSGNVVAFTFQEGWENGYTGQLLDILASKGVRASFYVTHEYADKNQGLVQRMINEGHDVGSHTYASPEIGIATYNLMDIMNDALQMQQYMHDRFGYDMSVYNFNAGTWSPGAVAMLSRMGYTIALCSTSYSDYSAYEAIDAGAMLPKLQAPLMPGTIYAFHVTNPATVQFIGPLIDYVKSQGYEIVVLK